VRVASGGAYAASAKLCEATERSEPPLQGSWPPEAAGHRGVASGGAYAAGAKLCEAFERSEPPFQRSWLRRQRGTKNYEVGLLIIDIMILPSKYIEDFY
jgi:hypothetical protein